MKIEYFPLRGRAEVIKLALAAKSVDWELVSPDYAVMKNDREQYPYGQCPRLIDGDISIVQSNTILRYLARKLDLNGSTEAEAIAIDMIIEGVESIRGKYATLVYQDALSEEAKAKYWSTHGEKASSTERCGGAHLEFLAYIARKNTSGFMVGSGLTMADLVTFDIVDLHARILGDQLKATYPELMALHEKVGSQPGIKEYRASPLLLEKINGNGLG